MKLLSAAILMLAFATSCYSQLEPVVVSKDGRGFMLVHSGQPFAPWGFNYATNGKFLEDMWVTDWQTIADDFREMKNLGANVVRIHLQMNQFMESADRPNAKSLEQLRKVLRLAEEVGIYLDITGLACYRPADVPKWYDQLSQPDRWRTQSRFWSAIAEVGANSPAIFCYDLMNEPVVPGAQREPGQWRSGNLLGGYDFVQFIALDAPDRPRYEVAADWIKTLTRAIRAQDKQHLITVGMLPSTKRMGHFSGFVPEKLAPELDFVSVHIYPESGKLDEAQEVAKQFAVGKPLVIEETFPMTCSPTELREFLLESRNLASGWMGHYEGQTIADLESLKKSGQITIPQSVMRDWLELFQSMQPEMTAKSVSAPK
jgi:hypothetical protein